MCFDDAVGLLEVIASERPNLLQSMVQSLIGIHLEEISSAWNCRTSEIPQVAHKAAKHLTRLEKLRPNRMWRHPSQVVEAPNVLALESFASARFTRVGVPRGRRLRVLEIKLKRIAEAERRHQQFKAFMADPIEPVDSKWLAAFLRRPS